MLLKMPPILVAFFVVSFFYWLMNLMVPFRVMIIMADAICIAFALAVVTVYARTAIQGLSRMSPDVYDVLLVGICGAWLFNGLDRSLRLYGRVSSSYWILDQPIIGYMLLSLGFFAALHLMVRGGASEGKLYREALSEQAKTAVAVTLGVGLMLGLVMVTVDQLGWLELE